MPFTMQGAGTVPGTLATAVVGPFRQFANRPRHV
jgi:hypothetical protein